MGQLMKESFVLKLKIRYSAALAALFFTLMPGAQSLAEPPNIVLLSIDTLRADRLSCYGYKYPTSPHIDQLAAEGLLFEDALCEVPLTAPSMGSMLSSQFPRMNGTGRNGLRLPDNVTLVTELLSDAGYHTFCVQSNWTLKARLSGIDRGFDVYDDDFHQKRWGIIKPERDGPDVTERALELLASAPEDKPFFAWIHYSDPHAPYEFHREYNHSGKRLFFMSRERKISYRYDTEVSFTDNEVGKILAALPENTVVVFVADHGESLFEHDYLGHGRRINQPSMAIPLIIRAPGVTPGSRSTAPVRGIDIGPTLLGLAGLQKTAGMLGLDLLNDEMPRARARVVETYGGAVPNLAIAESLMADADPLWQGVVLEGWKLVNDGRRQYLYHIAEDPYEEKDLSMNHPEKVARLQAHIDEWDAATDRAAMEEEDLTDDDWSALESLGYLD